jgi:transcriptional regulator with XRE-family HTH domain
VAGYGDVIRRLRRDKGIKSQTELAAKVGLDRETISRAENSGNVGILHLYKIADELGVKVVTLFGHGSKRDFPVWWWRLTTEQQKHLERLARAYLEED